MTTNFTLEQAIAQANLTPEQQKATAGTSINNYISPTGQVSIPAPTLPTTLNSQNTQSNPAIVIPPPPAPTNLPDANTTITGNNAALSTYTTPNGTVVDSNGKIVTPAPNTTPTTSTSAPNTSTTQGVSDYIKSLFSSYGTPPSAAETYAKTYGITPEEARVRLDQATADTNAKNATYKSAQARLAGFNAQLAGMNLQTTADNTKLETQGGAITASGVATASNQNIRDNLIRQAPIQFQALMAQADVATAQGDVELAQNIQQQAQGHLDALFKAQIQDADNAYKFRVGLIDKAYAYMDKQEQKKADELKIKEAQAFSLKENAIQNASAIAREIMTTQPALAAKISQIDWSKPDAQQTFATLQGQITQPKDLQFISGTDNQQAGYFDKNTGKFTPIGGVNPNNPTSPSNLVGLTPEQQKDPFIQTLLNSKGGKALTDTPLQQINKGLTVLGQLGALQTNISNTKTSPILGAFKGANPWDTNAQTIKAQLNAVVPNLARGIYGEVGVLTDNDVKNYSKTIGNLTSTNDVNNAIMYITLDLIGKSIKNTLEVQAAGGRDVSRFVDIYTNMQSTKNSILQSLPTVSLVNLGVTPKDEGVFDSIANTTSQTSSGGGFFSDIWGGITSLFK